MSDTSIPLDATFDARPGALVVLSPLIRRIVAPNASPMTFQGTNTYVVGHGEVAVVDPGPDLPDHIDAIIAALGTERVGRILVTHTHRDHSPGAPRLRARTGAPILGCVPHHPFRPPHPTEQAGYLAANDLGYAPDRVLVHGERFTGPGYAFEVVATPGHTMNHLAYALEGERALFSGDHVMAWSTTIVSPPSGSMAAYMASLELLRARDDAIYWPGHGGPVTDPPRFVRALQHHRRQREASILSRLRAGDTTVEVIVAATYESLDPRLKPAAALSVLAHLEDLVTRERVTQEGAPGLAARYRLAPAPGV